MNKLLSNSKAIIAIIAICMSGNYGLFVAKAQISAELPEVVEASTGGPIDRPVTTPVISTPVDENTTEQETSVGGDDVVDAVGGPIDRPVTTPVISTPVISTPVDENTTEQETSVGGDDVVDAVGGPIDRPVTTPVVTTNDAPVITAPEAPVINSGSRGSGGGGQSRRNTTTNGGLVLGAEDFKFLTDLSMGMQNADVMELQKRLRAEGFFTFPMDTGYFGPITLAAVKAYQQAHYAEIGYVTGFFGPLTRAVINQ